ncbi:MAG: hypothetical protein A2X22_05815 [Bacteroidetes bacterium GWF2_49_14]|nr:MAG: hypothetical protein A2X22_05815 [Bacteroidetes bacterium GWF2_49_14]
MKPVIILSTLALLVSAGCGPKKNVDFLKETEVQKDSRMEWWREARFGMFIHWGLYSVPAGEWNGSKNHAEWIRETAQIPLEEYDQFVSQFNPVKFNAMDWVRMAKDAGMKYIVITSKHHDGFALYNSRVSEFDIMATPFGRDALKELSTACKKEGITLCFYHSIMDWHHPDYLPRRSWEKTRTSEGADFNRYINYMKGQLKELLTRYGKLGVLWFDGEWENTWTEEYGKDLYQYVRSLQPDIIINNRVTTGRSGMAGLTESETFGGDFGTPEQEIPAMGLPGIDWESCMTMNDHWGYNKADKNFKSTREILHMLADIASKGGNYLLNIGPTSEGVFPQESIDRLREIGIWMKTNGESIYGTQASPFRSLSWGRCTQKNMTESTRLYLHVFDWPVDQKLMIPGLGSKPIRAYLLADASQEELTIVREGANIFLNLPASAPDAVNSVVVLDIQGKPEVYDAPTIGAPAAIFTDKTEVTISKNETLSDIHYTLDGSEPVMDSPKYTGPFSLAETTTVQAACFREGQPVSAAQTAVFTRVVAEPGRVLSQVKPGLLYNLYSGDWDTVPDFNGMTPKMTGIATDFTLANQSKDEKFAIDYQGFLNITEDGVYTFALSSDDGSLLYVGSSLAINHDGLHGATTREATLALGKGLHTLRISFFEKTGGNSLSLLWKKSGQEFVAIPTEAFYYYR